MHLVHVLGGGKVVHFSADGERSLCGERVERIFPKVWRRRPRCAECMERA